jgi:hypothetical protein
MITTFGEAAMGALANPILWVFLLAAAVLGGIGVKWPWALGVAIIAAILDSAINTYSRATAGLGFSPSVAVISFIAVALVYVAASAVRGITRR